MSAYIFIGAWFEERDLVRKYGDSYRDYQGKVPGYLPGNWRRLVPHPRRT
jgi:protein-S-isoprenylcysteine O-methyltransferase Ste14